MENTPIEDIGLIEDILPNTEFQESRTWFRNSLNQLGCIFAELANEENMHWDLLLKVSIGRLIINKVTGNNQDNSVWGKHLLTYGSYKEYDYSCTNHLYVLDEGKLVTQREKTKLTGPESGETSYSFYEGHTVEIFTSTFSEAETILNAVIENMNTYLENKIPKIEDK